MIFQPPSRLHHIDLHQQDPYFALIEDPKRPGKTKKVKKQIPTYIPDHDALILASAKKSAYRLDMCLFNFLGIRFGWEAVIGLVPMAGDAVGVALALLVFRKCCQVDGGLPNSVQTRMMINIILDFLVGLVPFLGDLADAAFKCNTKNVALLERHLDKKYRPSAEAGDRDARARAGANRQDTRRKRASGIFPRDDPPPATVFEDFSDDDVAVRGGGAEVRRPEPVRGASDRRPRPEMAVRPGSRRQETGTVRR